MKPKTCDVWVGRSQRFSHCARERGHSGQHAVHPFEAVRLDRIYRERLIRRLLRTQPGRYKRHNLKRCSTRTLQQRLEVALFYNMKGTAT